MERRFEQLDINDTGALEAGELRTLLLRMGRPSHARAVQGLLAECAQQRVSSRKVWAPLRNAAIATAGLQTGVFQVDQSAETNRPQQFANEAAVEHEVCLVVLCSCPCHWADCPLLCSLRASVPRLISPPLTRSSAGQNQGRRRPS